MKIFQILLSVFWLVFAFSTHVKAQNQGQLQIQTPESFATYSKMGLKAMEKNGTQGFRLQLFTGKKAEADLMKKKFLKSYPDVPAYIVFEIPNYKLHVGDFRLKIEAEGFREEISENFRGAFVLGATIIPFAPKVD